MPRHQKILTAILLLLIGMMLGILFMISRGSWISPERFEVTYTDVKRSTDPVDPIPGEELYSPSYIFKDIASDVIPAVVFIETSIPMNRAMPDNEDHQFEEPFWERFLPRHRAQSIGSGVLISTDGYILTNHHVIEGAEDRITVITNDKKEHKGRVVGSDPSTDLAVIKIDEEETEALVIGNSDHLQVGDWVMAIGNPFRLRSTVTAGIVSAKGRDVDIISDRMRIESFIQTDAAINRGNSGGALVNTRGELVGINTAIASESGTHQGYGFAVPINMAMKIGRDMIEYGEVQRAFLGVEIASLNYEGARNYGLETVSGVEILNVVPDGSADAGGLQGGDIVLQVNGYEVEEANHLQERIALMRPGETVQMKIWRNERIINIAFPLMGMDDDAIREWAQADPEPMQNLDFDQDSESGVAQEQFEVGFTMAELANPDNFSQTELIVINVIPGSRADRAGLKEEDIITGLNDEQIHDAGSFSAIWHELSDVVYNIDLHILRDGQEQTLQIPLN